MRECFLFFYQVCAVVLVNYKTKMCVQVTIQIGRNLQGIMLLLVLNERVNG